MRQTVIPGMSPAHSRTWLAFVSVAELLPAMLDQQLTRDAGLINFEYGILSVLAAAPGQTARMRDLGTALAAPAPRLSKAVTRLEQRGLIERSPCADDGRAINARLTRDGRRRLAQATPPHVALAKDGILGGFSDAELAVFAELLETVQRRLDPEGALGAIPDS